MLGIIHNCTLSVNGQGISNGHSGQMGKQTRHMTSEHACKHAAHHGQENRRHITTSDTPRARGAFTWNLRLQALRHGGDGLGLRANSVNVLV